MGDSWVGGSPVERVPRACYHPCVATRWKSYEAQLLDDASLAREMDPDARMRVLSELLDFVFRMLADTGTLGEKLRACDQVEEEGHRRWKEWVRRFRA